MIQSDDKGAKTSGVRPWIWVLIVAFVAQALCLRADFYMDDYGFILHSKGTAEAPWTLRLFGLEWRNFKEAQPLGHMTYDGTQLLPFLLFRGTYAIAGDSPMAFHAVNLLLHLAAAVAVLGLAGRFFRLLGVAEGPAAARLALWSALVFAAHPLATEPANYAKCVYVQLVTLFSVLTLSSFLGFWETGERRYLWRCGAMFFLTTISYTFGFPIVLSLMVVTSLLLWRARSEARLVLPRWVKFVVAAFCLVMMAWWARWLMQHSAVAGHTFSTNLLTQSRVFWEYLRRMALPSGLCSDHYPEWSQSWKDVAAVAALIGIIVLALGSFWAVWKKKTGPVACACGALLLLAAPLLIRLPYRTYEMMVEYRTYPSLPFVGMLFALGLAFLYKKSEFLARSAVLLLVAVFSLLSLQRASVWTSSRSICEDVVKQYPLNNRARTLLQDYHYNDENYAKVISLHAEVVEKMKAIAKFNAEAPRGRKYDFGRAEKSYFESEQFATLAFAELMGREYALKHAQAALDGNTRIVDGKKILPPHAGPLLLVMDALQKNADSIDADFRRKKRPDGEVSP